MKIKNLKFKIIFFGSSKYVIPIIEMLHKNFDLALVVTTERLQTDPVPTYCIKSKVQCYVARDFSNKTLQQLRDAKATIAVLASFGAIVPNEVLNLFPHGIINIHPSLLPKYRGPTPVQTAILNGDTTTGVSIIKLDKEVDHGPILEQIEDEILPNDTSESVYDRLFKLGASSIVSTIELYLKGTIKAQEQDHSKATFTKHLTRQDGYLDLSNTMTAVTIIDRMIRAYYPWPGVWTKFKVQSSPQRLGSEGRAKFKVVKFLPDKKIQVEGKKPVSYKDFINGYPQLRPVMLNLIQHLKS